MTQSQPEQTALCQGNKQPPRCLQFRSTRAFFFFCLVMCIQCGLKEPRWWRLYLDMSFQNLCGRGQKQCTCFAAPQKTVHIIFQHISLVGAAIWAVSSQRHESEIAPCAWRKRMWLKKISLPVSSWTSGELAGEEQAEQPLGFLAVTQMVQTHSPSTSPPP